MDLIVEGKGLFLGKHQGRLRLSREGKTVSEAPIIHLQQVIIVDTGVAISSDVVKTCAEEGIPIHFLSAGGRSLAGLYSAGLTGTVLTRRAQLSAFEDERGLALALAFVKGKIEISARSSATSASIEKKQTRRSMKSYPWWPWNWAIIWPRQRH